MTDHTNNLNIPQGPIPASPSVADVLREYHELNLPASSAGMKPLDPETLKVLQRVNGYADPANLASQLTGALHVLWVARKSGELPDDHADSMIWLLSEVSSQLEHAIEANQAATWWQAQHEKAVARAEQAMKAKPGPRRRKREQETAA